MKIASRKKNRPSMAKSTPKTWPKRPVNAGHSSPNSNESTVPVMAPTAKVTATTFDQRCARLSASWSPWRRPRYLAISISAGNATPTDARMMWKASVNAIWLRAASSCEVSSNMAGAPAARHTGLGPGQAGLELAGAEAVDRGHGLPHRVDEGLVHD